MSRPSDRNSVWVVLAALGAFLGGAAALVTVLTGVADSPSAKADALASIQSSCIGLAQTDLNTTCVMSECFEDRKERLADEAAICECANETLSTRSAPDLKAIAEIEGINLKYWAWHKVVNGNEGDADLNRLLKEQKTSHRLYSVAAQARHACRLAKK
jgi:hypothetical protein